MMNHSALFEIARSARFDLESKSVDGRLLASLYSEFNDIPDVVGFVRRSLAQFPRLGCGMASVYCRHKLGAGKIVVGSYAGVRHSFLLYDRILVDITADQFGGPPVYVGPLRQPWSLPSSPDSFEDRSAVTSPPALAP